jgi:nucleotide-binding universal stress UspA family protein
MADLNHILAATDLTDRSERALQRALELCRATHGHRLTLVHVIPAGLPAQLSDQQQRAAEAFLADRISRMPEQPSTSVEAVVRKGDAFGTIIGESIKCSADLVVIGAPGKHRYAAIFMGTTAELVMRFSDRPVLMVKQQPQASYRHVVVAFDASEGALRALRMALVIAPNAAFHIVHAWWPPHASFEEMDKAREALDLEHMRIKGLIHDAVAKAIGHNASSANITIEMIEDNPYRAISNQCAGADLIVMGTHSKGRLASTVSIGKLAQHLLVEASCDVLTSRP